MLISSCRTPCCCAVVLLLLFSAPIVHCGAVGPATDLDEFRHHHHGGEPLHSRWVSYWFSPFPTDGNLHHAASGNVSATLSLLERHGGTKVATSIMLYCGDAITSDGSFRAGSVAAGCDQMIAGLSRLSIGAERVVGATIEHLRLAFQEPNRSIVSLVALCKRYRLRGVSWDVEVKRSTQTDMTDFGVYLNAVRKAFRAAQLTVRVTSYVAPFAYRGNPIVSDPSDLQHSVDRLLDGDTYNFRELSGCTINCTAASNFSGWLKLYRTSVVNDNISRTKIAAGMLASTERGSWNCNSKAMRERIKQIEADGIREIAIFKLTPGTACTDQNKTNPDNGLPSCPCSHRWFPVAKDFLAGGGVKY